MKQEFTLLEDGKVKWENFRDDNAFDDKDFGKIGSKGGYDFIIFDDKEKAMSVLDRDVSEAEANLDKYKMDMDKNEHSLEKFPEIKDLVESVGKLHNDFKEIKNIPEELYKNNPKKYQKLLRDFNSAKTYIVDEMSAFNIEYQKYLNYKPAKMAYDFNFKQLEKIKEQKQKLLEL